MMPPALVDALADLSVMQAVSGAVALFAASLVPWFLLVETDPRAAWQAVCAWAAVVGRPVVECLRDAAALFLLLTTSPKGAMAA